MGILDKTNICVLETENFPFPDQKSISKHSRDNV